jgi:excisionase family DNA binding protein
MNDMIPVRVMLDADGHYWADTGDGLQPIRGLPRLYTVEEVAEYLGVTVHTVRYWRTKGYLEAIVIERCVRVTHQAILDLIESRTVGAWGRNEIPADSPFRPVAV